MWTRFRIRWDFISNVYASVPANPDLIEPWLNSRKPGTKPPQAKTIDEVAQEVIETLPELPDEEKKLLVFQRVEGALAMRASTVRAHLKECAGTLSSLWVGKVQGEKSFAVKVKNALYWPPEEPWIFLLTKAGERITRPDGILERPIHAMGPTGPINALKAFEYVVEPVMEFSLLILTTPDRTVGDRVVAGKEIVGEADLKNLMMYGGTHGYAGERSVDGGRYAFTISREPS